MNNDNADQTKMTFGEEEEKILEQKLTKNKVTPEMCRLAYYTLLNASMQFKEMFFRDDIEAYKNNPPPSVDEIRTKGTRTLTQKTIDKKKRENNESFEKRVLYFNKRCYQEIEGTISSMSNKAKESFDNTTVFLVSAVEELLSGKDQHEMLSLLKLYNAGELDMLFEMTRKQSEQHIHEELPKEPENIAAPTEQNL